MKNRTSLNGLYATSGDADGVRSSLTTVCAFRKSCAALTALFLTVAAFTAVGVTVKVDSTKGWQGYMNVWETNGTTYVFGSAWDFADLPSAFIPTNSASGWPLNTDLILKPNTNTYDPADPFWNFPDGSPNKVVEANTYVDVFTNFAGQTVRFEYTIKSNSLPAGWEAVAFVKQFNTDYSGFQWTPQTITGPGSFFVERAIPAGQVCQYGFFVKGPNTAPGSADSKTGVGILVDDPDPAVVTQPVAEPTYIVGDPISLTADGVGATPVSYRWQKDGTDVLDGGTVSGATTTNLLISPSAAGDGGGYTFIVSDTAGSATSDVARVTVVNVLITNQPSDMRVETGSTAVFKVGATSPSSLTYRWLYVNNGVTNTFGTPSPPFYNPPAYSSGATSDTLTLTNVQVSDTGTYVLRIYDGTSFLYVGADLLVKTPAEYVNFLENPGFESDPTGMDPSPWVRFVNTNSSYGALQSASDTYFGGDPVNVHGGTYVSFTTFDDNGVYSGIYQDVAAQPGQIFKADMWFYNAGGDGGDPIPGPELSATNESYLEVQFRNAANQVIHQYITEILDYTFPSNQWIDLQATNAGTYSTAPNPPPIADAEYLVAPPGTTTVRFQVTLHDIANSLFNGSIYYDDASLLLKIPADLTPTPSGDNVEISWMTQGATSYQVQYKDDLSDPSWKDLEVVPGDGTVVTKSYPAAGNGRLYRVLTL